MNPMLWSWPQWTMVIIYAINLLTASILDGRPKTEKHSAGVTASATIFAAFILWQGGFFK